VTWLNMISDQAMGLTGRVLSGTPRDTLHFVDLVYDPHGGPRPEVLITDQGSYSDLIFGIVTLLGFDYRPALADLPTPSCGASMPPPTTAISIAPPGAAATWARSPGTGRTSCG
jgi:hypothetical protein